MTFIKQNLFLALLSMTIAVFLGCDTTKTIYKSSSSKKDFITINAVTLTHCGCTHLYIGNFKNGKKDFQLFYNDNLARKTIL